jgi:hypothetical protein
MAKTSRNKNPLVIRPPKPCKPGRSDAVDWILCDDGCWVIDLIDE